MCTEHSICCLILYCFFFLLCSMSLGISFLFSHFNVHIFCHSFTVPLLLLLLVEMRVEFCVSVFFFFHRCRHRYFSLLLQQITLSWKSSSHSINENYIDSNKRDDITKWNSWVRLLNNSYTYTLQSSSTERYSFNECDVMLVANPKEYGFLL